MSGPTKLQRWLDLIACLVGHSFPVTADRLMQSVPAYAKGANATDAKTRESTRRKFERDKDELRALGIPIRTLQFSVDGEPTEGYQIDKCDFYLPYLNIVTQIDASDATQYTSKHKPSSVTMLAEDVPLAINALRRVGQVPGFPFLRESRSAFRKLAFELDMQAFDRTTPVLFVDRPGAAELTQKVRILSDALKMKKRAIFAYHGMYRGETTQREVDGYGLMFQHGHWYLVGHDATRDDIRVFRVGRMDDIAYNTKKPGTPDYEIPKNFRLSAYGDRDPWVLGDQDEKPLDADVRFAFPLSLWADRNAHGTLIDKLHDGSQVRRFALHQVEPFLRWILSFEGEAEILAPASLRDELKTHALLVAHAHETHGGAPRANTHATGDA